MNDPLRISDPAGRRIPCLGPGDQAAYALVGLASVVLFAVAVNHELAMPGSGAPMTVACGFLLLGSALLSFAWGTASVGISSEGFEQCYFGWKFRTVRYEEIGVVDLAPWG